MSESSLLILGDRQAIAWVLRDQWMAFPPTSRVEVDRLAVGDGLLTSRRDHLPSATPQLIILLGILSSSSRM